MRKVAIPVALVLFLSAATPVFAATLHFSDLTGWLHIFRLGSTPIGLDGPVQKKITPYIYPTGHAIPIHNSVRPTGVPPLPPTSTPGAYPTTQVTPMDGVGGPIPTSTDEAKTAKVKDVISQIPDNYQQRLNQYGDFLTKVKSRRDKLAAGGKDVTKVDQFITTATDNLATAQTVLSTEKNTLGNLDPTQDPAQLEKTVHDQLTVVRQSMTAVNNSMSATVRQIVAVSGGTTTPKASATEENVQRQNGAGNQQHLPPGPANRK